jgi:hypothetical protein
MGILGVTMHTNGSNFCHISRRNHIFRILFVYMSAKQDDLWERMLMICMP